MNCSPSAPRSCASRSEVRFKLGVAVLILMCLLAGAWRETRAGGFQRTDFTTGSCPFSVAVADLNGDGALDLVTANENSSTVSVLLGHGDGAFGANTDFASGPGPSSIAIGDLNRDGRLDVATANYGAATVSVLLGNGDGTFGLKSDFATGSGPFSVAIGDLDCDGNPDLVVGNYYANTVSVLRNTTPLGGAIVTFGAHSDFATGAHPTWVAIADLNRDGKPDLAAANQADQSVSVLLNTTSSAPGSAAAFAPKTDLPIAGNCYSVAIGDLNGDGKLDLAAGNQSLDAVSVRLGNGDGSFGPNADFAAGDLASAVAIGDLNRDGHPDIAVTNQLSNTVSVLTGNGDGTFGPHLDILTGDEPTSIGMGDFDQDGTLDLGVANHVASAVSVLLNGLVQSTGPLAFGPNLVFAAAQGPFSVAIGDLNRDGRADLATANQVRLGNTSVLLGNGDGTFGLNHEFATGPGPTSVAIGDLNRDGKLDMATANFGAVTVSVLLGNGDGTFGSNSDFATGLGPFSVAIGDLNGDGKLDLAVGNYYSNTAQVLLNLTPLGGTVPVFAPPTEFGTGTHPTGIAIGDLNRDGKLDLATANQSGQSVSILLNTTSSTPGVPAAFAPKTDLPIGGNCYSVAIGDLNGDGKPDLAAGNQTLGAVSVRLGNGNGTFGPNANFTADFLASSVAIGDLNGDGKADVVVANEYANTVSVLINATPHAGSSAAFEPRRDFATAINPVSVAIGDLNGDGKLDLTAANYTGPGKVSVLLNTTPLSYATVAPVAAASEIDFGPAASNPSQGAASIELSLPREMSVRVGVFDAMGRRVAVLANGVYPAGRHIVSWDGTMQGVAAPAGIYFVCWQGDRKTVSRRVAITR